VQISVKNVERIWEERKWLYAPTYYHDFLYVNT